VQKIPTTLPRPNRKLFALSDNLRASPLLLLHGETVSHTHTMPADEEIPDDAAYKQIGKQIPAPELIYDTVSQKVDRSGVSELIYEDMISQKVDRSNASELIYEDMISQKVYRSSASELIYQDIISLEVDRSNVSKLNYGDTISQKNDEGSINLSSRVNYSVVTPQSTPDANSSITIQPSYCNTPITVCPQAPSVYVKMYKVKPLIQDNDQTSDTQSEVYSFDYVYYRNLRLRKYGKECDGVPPRSIRRSGYTQSADYVNARTWCDYVNFKTLENTPIASPPRGCLTGKSGAISGKETAVKPIPKQRTNVRPALPARNIPRQKYYLSGPLAVPPNYM